MTTVTPRGGTELLNEWLTAALPDETSQVQIILSRPDEVVLENKPRILWLHDLPNDPASANLRSPSYRTKFNKIVFVSHWQQQQYNQVLGIPFHEGLVIKNGIPARPPVSRTPLIEKLKFIYTSTPHRGLEILAESADRLAKHRQDWELHVYSSLKIYARHEQDKYYEPLYERLRKNPCVHYHGTVSNTEVREAVERADVFVYPSIYPETSCMAIQEALMAGCLCITTSLGALIETCGEWAWMMQYHESPEALAQMTTLYMNEALERYADPAVQMALSNQASYYSNYYTFESRVPMWRSLLHAVIAQGTPDEKLIVG